MMLFKSQATISEVYRHYALTPSEIQSWINYAQNQMENALRTNGKDISEQCEQKNSELASAYGGVMLESKVLKNLHAIKLSIVLIYSTQEGMGDDGDFVYLSQLCDWFNMR